MDNRAARKLPVIMYHTYRVVWMCLCILVLIAGFINPHDTGIDYLFQLAILVVIPMAVIELSWFSLPKRTICYLTMMHGVLLFSLAAVVLIYNGCLLGVKLNSLSVVAIFPAIPIMLESLVAMMYMHKHKQAAL